MPKEPSVDHAPWSEIEAKLDGYIGRAKRLRDAMYLLAFLGLLAAVVGVITRSFYALYALILVLGPRVVFALWNQKNQPKCPGCSASLGFDWRGSPSRTRQVYEEHACPSCGIPFTA